MTQDGAKQKRGLRGGIAAAIGWLPAIPAILLLAAAPLAGIELRARAIPATFVDQLSVRESEAPKLLGWRELGQHPGARSAGADHLLVVRENGAWAIANRSADRRVFVRTDRIGSRYLQRWRLRTGDRITLADAELEVTVADDERLVIKDLETARQVAWDDGSLEPGDEPIHTVCRSLWSRVVQKARWLFRNVNGDARPEFPLFTIGGSLNCSERWKHPKLPPRGITVTWHAGHFWLAPGARRHDVLMQHAGSEAKAFAELTMPLSGPEGRVERIILGRTNYRLLPGDGKLDLLAVANVDMWFEEEPEGSFRKIEWAGAGAKLEPWLRDTAAFALPGIVALVGAILLIGWHWSRRRYLGLWWPTRAILAAGPAALGGWLAILLMRGIGAPDAMLLAGMVWLAWAWATLMLILSRRIKGIGGWIWVAALFLAGAGAITLLQLGSGAENTRWMSFVTKHALLLSLFGWIVSAMTAITDAGWRRAWLWIFRTESLAAGLAAVLVFLMMVQLALGSEEGIGGIQPVEVTKSVFVILLAFLGMHFTEIRRRETSAYRLSPITVVLPFLRFVGIFFVVVFSLVVGVRDFSPMIILGLVTLAWLWRTGVGQGEQTGAWLWTLLRPAVLLVLVLIAGGALWAYKNAASLPEGMPQKDRVLVWAEPELHPHSGAQVLGAMDRVGEGKWLGSLDWFGPNGRVMTLPAVQDDFITAFFLHRFGGASGLALLGFQLLYLIGLFALARRVERESTGWDFKEQTAGHVLGYTLFGLAWMQVAHWTIAWSNTLGLLPVMGQPMTWMSAGNSHLIGFALVTLSIALITAWSLRPAEPR